MGRIENKLGDHLQDESTATNAAPHTPPTTPIMMKTAMLCACLSALVLGAAGKARPADHFGEPALAEYFEDGYDGPWIQREMSPRLVGHGSSGAIPEDEEDETSNRRSLLRHKTKGKKWGHGKKGKWGGKKGWGHGKKHHGKKWGKKWGKQYRG